ncbi:hypothetical protein [Phyllobacterium zundukense]|jgi:hypothetical protein|uniref:Uncharacterized protein n=1 Tax=Phyllobacterium zundukense TaxID=1867719 RepID=A0ACD4D3Q3_9HYPH|nr:hypothetical protein [Phyllobacterium zundukense]UXN60546.1 hypothetical protein N8E88_29325 [Phyllobacterium zundukense]
MWTDALFIIFWLIVVGVGAILVAEHESKQSLRQMNDRIAEINKK